MRGDRTNYGMGASMTKVTVRLTKQEIQYLKSCKVRPAWSIPFTIRQLILEHRELRENQKDE